MSQLQLEDNTVVSVRAFSSSVSSTTSSSSQIKEVRDVISHGTTSLWIAIYCLNFIVFLVFKYPYLSFKFYPLFVCLFRFKTVLDLTK